MKEYVVKYAISFIKYVTAESMCCEKENGEIVDGFHAIKGMDVTHTRTKALDIFHFCLFVNAYPKLEKEILRSCMPCPSLLRYKSVRGAGRACVCAPLR